MAFGDPEVMKVRGIVDRQLLNDKRTGEVVPYVHQDYPKMKYHAVHQPKVVNIEEEESALGKGWNDTPAGVHAQGREISKRDLEILAERGHPVHNIREAREYIEKMEPKDRAAYFAAVHHAEAIAVSHQAAPGPIRSGDLDLDWDDSHILTPEIYEEDDAEKEPEVKAKGKAKPTR